MSFFFVQFSEHNVKLWHRGPVWPDVRTELIAASVLLYFIIGRVEARTPKQVTNLCSIYLPITTVPEVKEVEDFSYVCKTNGSEEPEELSNSVTVARRRPRSQGRSRGRSGADPGGRLRGPSRIRPWEPIGRRRGLSPVRRLLTGCCGSIPRRSGKLNPAISGLPVRGVSGFSCETPKE